MKTRNDSQNITRGRLSPEYWVEVHGDYLYSQACFRLNDQKLARETVLDTFLCAVEQKDELVGMYAEREWLMAILNDKMSCLFHPGCTEGASPINLGEDVSEDIFFNEADGRWNEKYFPLKINFSDFRTAQIHNFLQKLPDLWRYVLTMKFVEGEPTESLIRKLKISREDFWEIIHKSKVSLRSYLQNNRS